MSAARSLLSLAVLTLALAVAPVAGAAGGSYVFRGGEPQERAEVRAALEASAFPWDVVPATVTIHIGDFAYSRSQPGHIFIDRGLLGAGRFAWAVVQDEYAHQVDFLLFDRATRGRVSGLVGGQDWCYGVPGLRHDEYGCERFASTLVWAYWPSVDNAYRPRARNDEAAAMAPAAFRQLMTDVLGLPKPRALASAKRSAGSRK